MGRVSALVGALLALLAVIWPAGAMAEGPPARTFKVYMVLWRGETPMETAFRAYMAEHGLKVDYVVRNIDQNLGKLPEVIADIRAVKPDLVYTWGTSVSLGVLGPYDAPPEQAARYITDIPAVFVLVTDPVGAHLVRSVEHPGRPITGTSHMAPIAAQLNAMEAYRPFHRVGNIYNPAELNSLLYSRQFEREARAKGLDVVSRPIPVDAANRPSLDALPGMIAGMAADKVDFLYIGPDSFIGSNAPMFTEAAIAAGLKVFVSTEQPLRNGRALIGLISSYYNLGLLTAVMARQILDEGKSPADIPVATLKRFSYVVNISVARQLRAYPPMTVLRYAEVIPQ